MTHILLAVTILIPFIVNSMPAHLSAELDLLANYVEYDQWHYNTDTHTLTLRDDGEIVYQDGTYLHTRYYELLGCAEWLETPIVQCYPLSFLTLDPENGVYDDADKWIEFTHHAMVMASFEGDLHSIVLYEDGSYCGYDANHRVCGTLSWNDR